MYTHVSCVTLCCDLLFGFGMVCARVHDMSKELPDLILTETHRRITFFHLALLSFFFFLFHLVSLFRICTTMETGECPFCTAEEDCFHLSIGCTRSRNFWTFIGLDLASLPEALGVDQLWIVNPFQENDRRIASTILICVLWNIWKCRNMEVFRNEDESNLLLSRRCHEDLVLWSNRCSSSAGRLKLVEWSNFFPV